MLIELIEQASLVCTESQAKRSWVQSPGALLRHDVKGLLTADSQDWHDAGMPQAAQKVHLRPHSAQNGSSMRRVITIMM